MSSDRAPIRSYQRIFKPERRIYQVEGHRLPVPGGVPLRWLGYALATLLAILLLSSRSLTLGALAATAAAVYALLCGARSTAIVAGAVVLGSGQALGYVLAGLDWPLRLLVAPALVATLATQATPDGRPAHRFALSWVGLQLRAARRSMNRPLPALGEARDVSQEVPVACDPQVPRLRRGRVLGPARVTLRVPLTVSRSRLRRGRLTATVPHRRKGGAQQVGSVDLASGEVLELRP